MENLTGSALNLLQALEGAPVGKRGKHKRTVRKWAEALGHNLGEFNARWVGKSFGKPGFIAYHVAHCLDCEAAAFTGCAQETNPALDRKCPGKQRRET